MKSSQAKFVSEMRGASRGGFTLTDLVVVLAVVAILASLLVSARAGGKDQSKAAQCSGNLRQFAQAMQIFSSENKDKLPVNDSSNWAWDLGWNAGTTITQWISFRQLYCPGTSVRFTEQDNLNLWSFMGANVIHVIGYALTLPGSAVITTNLNATLTPQRILSGAAYLPAPAPSQRVLVADATLSNAGQYSYSLRYSYNYTDVPGGYSVHHLSAHLTGAFPSGGNVGMLDGHVEWRPFDAMQCRVNSGIAPGFWW